MGRSVVVAAAAKNGEYQVIGIKYIYICQSPPRMDAKLASGGVVCGLGYR